MIVNCLIYTTTSSQFFKKDLNFVKECLMRAKGVEDVLFEIKTISAPENPLLIKDTEGDTRFAWDWFDQRFVVPVKGQYNAVAFHFTPYYKRKWGLSARINGSYHNDPDGVLDFWFSCYDKQSLNYDFSEAARIMIHEFSHGFARWTGKNNQLVHPYDYNFHTIHTFPEMVSFQDWNILKRIVNIITDFFKKYGTS